MCSMWASRTPPTPRFGNTLCGTICVVISKDEDFLYLVNAPEAKGRFIWIRFGNCRTKALLTAIESLWPKVEARLKAGDRIIELR